MSRTDLRSWPDVLEHLDTIASRLERGKHAWQIYRTLDAGRPVYYGRPLYWLNGRPFDPLHRKHYLEEACCVRCGHGRARAQWTFAAPLPTRYTVERWITMCFRCLGYWLWLWPETFPSARLGIVVPQPRFPSRLSWGRVEAEKTGTPMAIDSLWPQRQPFGEMPIADISVPIPVRDLRRSS